MSIKNYKFKKELHDIEIRGMINLFNYSLWYNGYIENNPNENGNDIDFFYTNGSLRCEEEYITILVDNEYILSLNLSDNNSLVLTTLIMEDGEEVNRKYYLIEQHESPFYLGSDNDDN